MEKLRDTRLPRSHGKGEGGEDVGKDVDEGDREDDAGSEGRLARKQTVISREADATLELCGGVRLEAGTQLSSLWRRAS